MSRDLIAEVADEVGNRWHAGGRIPMASDIEHHIAAVLRERFEVRDAWFATCGPLMPCKALVERTPAPVPTVAEAARALVEWTRDENRGKWTFPLGNGLYGRMDALRAALAAEEAKR